MGKDSKDNREWRKQVKKLRRSRIRKGKALEREKFLVHVEISPEVDSNFDEDQQYEENLRNRSEAEWIYREEQAQLAFEMKQAEEQAKIIARETNEKRIRVEWEQFKKIINEEREKKELEEKERNAKQETEFNQLLDFLSGDIENPPQPYLMPETLEDGKEVCLYFSKTAACRFFDYCKRSHIKPTLSSTILIPNFFCHFSLEESLRDEFDSDLSLEYEHEDMHKEFLNFYEDVMPELQTAGKVVQFKVCCNFAAHLRGNVYVQYDNVREAVQAHRTFNARFYNGKQLTVQFVRIPSWKSAICGLFNRRRCISGKTCNFLHVFRNPTKEFVSADNDWAEPQSKSQSQLQNVNQEESEKRTPNSNTKISTSKPGTSKRRKLRLPVDTSNPYNSDRPRSSRSRETDLKDNRHSPKGKGSNRKERNSGKGSNGRKRNSGYSHSSQLLSRNNDDDRDSHRHPHYENSKQKHRSTSNIQDPYPVSSKKSGDGPDRDRHSLKRTSHSVSRSKKFARISPDVVDTESQDNRRSKKRKSRSPSKNRKCRSEANNKV